MKSTKLYNYGPDRFSLGAEHEKKHGIRLLHPGYQAHQPRGGHLGRRGRAL